MKNMAVAVLSVSLLVLVSVLGSTILGSNVFAQPPQPMGEEVDFLGQELPPIESFQGADAPQGYQYFYGVFTGEAGDFQGALDAAIAEALDAAGCKVGEPSEDCDIRYRVTDTQGKTSFSEESLVYETRVRILAWR